MKIPGSILQKYDFSKDVDSRTVLAMFDEEPGARILEVGAHDEPIANLLTECGYLVTGIDLRDYDPELPLCNYHYLQCDFCDLPTEFLREHLGTMDAIISVSAIEHFGLGTYQEGLENSAYDIIASRTMWMLLKEGGHVYLSVPFGRDYIYHAPHWRVYNRDSFIERIVQDFTPLEGHPAVAANCDIGGKLRRMGEPITTDEARAYPGFPPHVSVVAKLKKVSRRRLAPKGR